MTAPSSARIGVLRSTAAIAATPLGGQAALYSAAAEAIRAGGSREMQADRLRACLSEPSAWAALMDWAVFRYIDFVAADMAGGNGGGHTSGGTQRLSAPAEPLSEATGHAKDGTPGWDAPAPDAGREAGSNLQPKPGVSPAREPSPAAVVAARKAAERAALTIMDTIKVRDGRAIGDVSYGELGTLAATSRREAALFDLIKAHARPASEFARVREVVKVNDLQRMVQKAAEISDAH